MLCRKETARYCIAADSTISVKDKKFKIMGTQWAFAEKEENANPANPVYKRICGI
ncbi:MAG: hypothetical protein K2H23_02205 [Oscillospiraceae bacterium]|nr:hypothetical protein [Oscillospiraceae bacterium]